jgi:hypothetical protein
MNNVNHLEHSASSSQGKHEGESSLGLCDRLDRTRANSQRQLPTDHDYAVPTREYQTDQSSPSLHWLLLALSSGKQRQQHHRWRRLTRSLHTRPMHALRSVCRPVVAGEAMVFRESARSRWSSLREDVLYFERIQSSERSNFKSSLLWEKRLDRDFQKGPNNEETTLHKAILHSFQPTTQPAAFTFFNGLRGLRRSSQFCKSLKSLKLEGCHG